MRNTKRTESWVIYQVNIRNKPGRLNAVCEQSEWDEMVLLSPGFYTLVKTGFMNEAEAESMARNSQPAASKVPALARIPRS